MLSNRTRLVIADDHTLIANLCKQLLEPEYEVAGIVSDGRALIRAADVLHPEVIIADIEMPILNGLDAIEQVKKLHPKIKAVILTMTSDTDVAAEAFRRGASGYMLKTCAPSELVTCIREVLRGGRYLSPTLRNDDFACARIMCRDTGEREKRLTSRQREVLQLLAEGKLMKEVGGILHMSTRTVAFHKYRIMEVLGARSSAELVRYAVRNHMVGA
ncbi:MAG TPA: response regulator transcription factor [Terriglobales bacterium]|jgi:DNA-binding NarL/FixJ family response regulator